MLSSTSASQFSPPPSPTAQYSPSASTFSSSSSSASNTTVCYFTYTPHSHPNYTPLESGVSYPASEVQFIPSRPIARWSSFAATVDDYPHADSDLALTRMTGSSAVSSSQQSGISSSPQPSTSHTTRRQTASQTPPSFVSFDSSDSTNTTGSSGRSSSSSISPPTSLDYVRCLRCQRGLSVDSSAGGISPNAVRLGTNLYYCKRCAGIVGYKG